MTFSLLHIADLHLGKSFSTMPPERAEQRRADLLATLGRACRTARERRVNLLCIAGDLFDRARPAMPLLAAARQSLADAGVPVLLLSGNHDPLESGSPYLEGQWPGNVLVADQPGWQRIAVDGCETWAFGYQPGDAHRNPWESFPGCSRDALLALHAACVASVIDPSAGYYQFTPPQIPACAYLALGHFHRSMQMSRRPVCWYAGSPEPLEPEVTPATALHVTLHDSEADVEPIPVATRHYRQATLDVTGLTAADIWDRALAQATMDDLLCLQLTGLLEASESLDLGQLQAELSSRAFAVEVRADQLLLPPSSAEATGAMAALLALSRARLEALSPDDPARARLEQAVRYAALALEGRL